MNHSESPLGLYFGQLQRIPTLRWRGRVTQVVGQLVESDGPTCSVGERCEITSVDGQSVEGEVVGFRGPTVLTMPIEKPAGIRYGDQIATWGSRPSLHVSDSLIGRVIDGKGASLDGRPAPTFGDEVLLDSMPPLPLSRVPIREPLGCGIRAIDACLTCGRGQRMGIFGGSGVGKTTLIGMMTRGTSADLTVLGLIGERGREVPEFLEELGPKGRERSVVVVSTSDQSPLLRIRAATAATAIAEYFCAQGKNVLLVIDSLTRFAMAQREIGLAAGEPPTSKGYTPSVFSLLARLVERAGRFATGSITAFYTVLMEGDDLNDPVVDSVRSLLDGHIVLDRLIASRSHYPPISILDSLSRLMPAVVSQGQMRKVKELRTLLASYQSSEDLVRIGAYQRGTDPTLDRALAGLPAINEFLQQERNEEVPIELSIEKLMTLPS